MRSPIEHKSNILRIKKVVDFTLDILFPKYCFACEQEGAYICKACLQKAFVQTNTPHTEKNTFVAGSYKNHYLREIIHYLKYHFIQELATPLGDFLSQFFQQRFNADFLQSSNNILVPVPLHPKKFRQRGFNQSELIARGVSKNLNIPVALALKKIKSTAAQMTIEERDTRLANVKHTFACDNSNTVQGKTIFVIDDVITTGATMEECNYILTQAGAKKVFKIAVAG